MKTPYFEEKHNYLIQQLVSFLSLIGVTSATKVTVMSYEMVGIGLSVFFIGIPLFWNFRSRELL